MAEDSKQFIRIPSWAITILVAVFASVVTYSLAIGGKSEQLDQLIRDTTQLHEHLTRISEKLNNLAQDSATNSQALIDVKRRVDVVETQVDRMREEQQLLKHK